MIVVLQVALAFGGCILIGVFQLAAILWVFNDHREDDEQ